MATYVAGVSLFNPTAYLALYTDVAKAAGSLSGQALANFAFTHFVSFGAAEGRDPLGETVSTTVVTGQKAALTATLTAGNLSGDIGGTGAASGGVFDAAFYLRTYSDVNAAAIAAANAQAQSGVAVPSNFFAAFALSHFVQYGAAENRSPSANFAPVSYTSAQSDVANAIALHQTTAIQHYLQFGEVEGRAAPVVTGGTNAGTSLSLTTGADNVPGTSGDDTISGVADTAANGGTFSVADIINGGGGNDTLSLIDTAGNFTISGTNLTSVEKIAINATAAAVINFTNLTGVTDLINNQSGVQLNLGTVAATAGAVNSLINLTVTGATAGTTLSYSDTALTGSADAMTLTLNGTGTATTAQVVKISQNTGGAIANQLETLAIVANNTVDNITLTTDGTQTSLKTINISGAANLTVGLAADNIITSATVWNASTDTGGVTIGADAGGQALGAANDNITLGSGNDAVFFGANLTAADTVAGGAGTDTLGVSAAVTNAIMANVSAMEVLRLDVTGAATITQDAGISSLSGFSYAVAGAGTVNLNNVAGSSTTTIAQGAVVALTEALKDSSGLSDALNITISNGPSNAATSLTTLNNITGLETLNLVSTGGTATNTITTDSVTATHVLTGSSNLTITNAIATSAFNASAFTGKLVITGQAAVGTNIQSGSGADTITLGTAADTVSAGAGNDVINLGSTGITPFGADVLSGGAGNDTFKFTATEGASAALTTYGTFATITDFNVGTSTASTDLLQFSAADTNFGASNATPTATLGLAKGSVTQSLTVGDTMVVQSITQNASAAALTANVSFFKLATGVAFTTTIAQTAAAAIGTASVTGLAADSVYLMSFYDTTNSKAVIVTVDTGASVATDTALSAADFVVANSASMHVVGVLNMTAADYANFGATNLAVAGA